MRKHVKEKNRYTFDNFVTGKSNAMAYAICLDVAKKQLKYNPIYIYGGVGVGKTHLLKAIINYYVEHYKNLKVLYITCKDFTDNYVESIIKHTEKKMVDKYKKLDLLLIDEIEYLINKIHSQEELFKTFNLLHSEKVQIVFASALSINKLNNFDKRLKSRFAWGAICEIYQPDYRMRLDILKLKSKELCENYHIDDKVLRYIAKNVKSDVRKLEGCLNRISTFSKIQNKKIDIDAVDDLLNNV